jgi:cytochrome c553
MKIIITALVIFISLSFLSFAADCVTCHKNITPNIVSDWQLSKHSQNDVSCETCHGSDHTNASNVDKVSLPTPQTCQTCHETQVEQYSKGKHAFGWASMKAMPTFHMQPMALTEGMKGCGSCHKIGLKSEEEIKQLKVDGQQHGVASCDACHTRHTFSKLEAQQPQACQTCHMGFDHPQWEMYSSSKHGVRYLLKQNGVLSESTSAPTCQTCHMQDGNHEVRTAWGFLAVKLPLPEDEQWKNDQITILQALGVLDPEGNPTSLLDVVKAADVARLDQQSFDKERNKILSTCGNCHSEKFAKAELERLAKINPDDVPTKILLADTYAATKRFDQAEKLYKEVKSKSDDNSKKDIDQKHRQCGWPVGMLLAGLCGVTSNFLTA